MAQRQKTRFGRLLDSYRHKKEVSQTELQHLLKDYGFNITVSLVSKYEYGDRDPSPAFIYYTIKCLDLTEPESNALIDAHFADIHLKFFEKYKQEALKDRSKRRSTQSD